MTITWDAIEQNDELEAAIRRGIAHIDGVHIIATSNFENAVRKFYGYENYSADRSSGRAGAKTITQDSEQYILLSIPDLLPFGVKYLERVVCHETGHALSSARGETDFRQLDTDSFGDADLRLLATHILDEYRSELLAVELQGASSQDPEDLGHLLHVANCEILNALVTVDIKTEELALVVLKTVERVGKQVAVYLANDPRLNLLNLIHETSRVLWNSYLGSSWEYLASTLALAPSAQEAIGDLDALISSTTGATRIIVENFGFKFDPRGGFWRTGSDALFDSRVHASHDFVAAHPE